MIDNIVAIDPMESVTITELNFVKHYGKAGEDLLDRVRDTEREKVLSEIESMVKLLAIENKQAKPADKEEEIDERAYNACCDDVLAKLNQLKGKS